MDQFNNNGNVKESRKKRVTLSEKIAKLNRSEAEAAEVLANLQVTLRSIEETESSSDSEKSCDEDVCCEDEENNMDCFLHSCFYCKLKFTSKLEFDEHIETPKHVIKQEMQRGIDHEMLETEKSELCGVKMPVRCSLCLEVFWRKPLFVKHQRAHNNSFPFKCTKCSMQFNDQRQLRVHLKKHFGFNLYACPHCDMKFQSNNKLETHLISKHDKEDMRSRKFKCNECGGRFLTKVAVNLHLRCHTGFRPFKCSDCSKGFHNAAALNEHKRIHSGEKPFKCEVCSYTARTSQLLKRHNRSHTGNRPYQCKECEFSCKLSTGLKRHMLKHSGSRPFKCPYCEYRCNNIENLRKHVKKVKKHHGLCVYPCNQCAFASDDGLQYLKHMKQFHFPHLDLKTETAAKISGIFCCNQTVTADPIQEKNCQTVIKNGSSSAPIVLISDVFQNGISHTLQLPRMENMNEDILPGDNLILKSNTEKGDILLSSMAPVDMADHQKGSLKSSECNLASSSKSAETFNAASFLPEPSCSTSILTESNMCLPPEINREVTVTDNRPSDVNSDELSTLVKLSNLQKIIIPRNDEPLMLVVNGTPGSMWDKSNTA